MVQKAFLILLILLPFVSNSQNLESIRSQYPKAKESSEITDRMYEELSGVSGENHVLSAYKGAISALKADFAKGIKNKKDFFKEGAELLDQAVAAEPENVEIRYLRLTVQENAPKIVGYHGNIDEDKEVIKNRFHNLESDSLKAVIRGFIKISSNFDKDEKSEFQ